MGTWSAFLTGIIAAAACFAVLDAVQVQIFKDVRFKGLIYDYESNVNESLTCHNVKDYARGDAGSVKTDTCLMIYERTGCYGNSFKLSRDMTVELENLRRPIFSFSPCNSSYGGDKVRVEMFDENSKLIGKYKDICGCQDLPSQITTSLQKLNNFGNCLAVYSTSTCSGSSTEIPAGQNGVTQNLPQLGYYVRSISACGARRACVRLSSEIFKFVFRLDTTRAKNAKTKTLYLATKTTFYNNGSATVFQEYEARRRIKESTTIGLSTTITKMHDSKVSENVVSHEEKDLGGVNLGIYKTTTKVTETVKETYTSERTETETASGSYTHETESEFAVRQVIEVPPCVSYEIHSTVEVVENLPIVYDVFTKVTGESSGRKMTAEEVATKVDELTFVELLDEYTAVFKSTHKLMANIGVDTKISGEGKNIPGCMRE